jgi:Icc-related predicted phosphoesterase
MRIVAIGDIHQHPEHCGKIPGLSACDYLLAHGDLTNFGGRGAVSRVITALRAFCPQVLAQTGNLDRRSGDKFLTEEGINLHGRARLLRKDQEKLIVIGLGGANRTFFFTPNEFREDEMARLLRAAWQEASDLMEGGANIPLLLLTHAPPYGVSVDRLRTGRHVGSKAVRAFIEERQPALCVCGHIHEGKGKDQIGATGIVNTGAFFQGGWVDIRVAGGIASAELF